MPQFMRLSGLERAAEIAEQHPEAVAAIVEMLDLFAARNLDSLAWDALDALESENPLLLEELLKEHGLASYLEGVVQRYRDEEVHLLRMAPSMLDAERVELLREHLIPPPSHRTRKGKLSPECKRLLKNWKAAIKAMDETTS